MLAACFREGIIHLLLQRRIQLIGRLRLIEICLRLQRLFIFLELICILVNCPLGRIILLHVLGLLNSVQLAIVTDTIDRDT